MMIMGSGTRKTRDNITEFSYLEVLHTLLAHNISPPVLMSCRSFEENG